MPYCNEMTMKCFLEFSWFQLFMNVIRYYPLALVTFLVFWVWKKRAWFSLRIQQRWPASKRLWYEIAFSFSTLIIFTLVALGAYTMSRYGYMHVYLDPEQYGYGYMVLSFFMLCVFHETWFYWMHRAVHHPKLFKWIHLVHHKSVNPSPFTAYSFHPGEAVLEAIYIPIFALFLPLHPYVIIAQTIYAMVMNIWFHSGYEILPSGWTRGLLTRWVNTATHHNMHHSHINANFSLYFNFWDRICGTNHEKYDEYYEGVVARRGSGGNEFRNIRQSDGLPQTGIK